MLKIMEDAQVIFINHSGGKDSQAMTSYIKSLGHWGKCVIVHADLGDMEHEPMKPWIESISFDKRVNVVESPLDFFELARKYNRIPDGRARLCTDQLKTVPCERFMREHCKRYGFTNAVSVLGIRAEESTARAKKNPIVHKTKLLTVINPIFDWTIEQVFAEIKRVDQVVHRIYSEGFSRLSCKFCVLGRIGEHQLSADKYPEIFAKFVQLEKDLGKTIRLKQIKGVKHKKYLTEYIKINQSL